MVRTVEGPVVLVAHSYGGAVISNVDSDGEIAGLVYVNGFAPEPGENCFQLCLTRTPESRLKPGVPALTSRLGRTASTPGPGRRK